MSPHRIGLPVEFRGRAWAGRPRSANRRSCGRTEGPELARLRHSGDWNEFPLSILSAYRVLRNDKFG